MTTPTSALSLDGLEIVYDHLAQAIDRTGADKRELFLVKLALLNAHALGDAERFQQQLEKALLNL